MLQHMMLLGTILTTAVEIVAEENEIISNKRSSVQTSTCVGHGERSLGRPGSDANSLAARALHTS
jgi:hypothetical protein